MKSKEAGTLRALTCHRYGTQYSLSSAWRLSVCACVRWQTHKVCAAFPQGDI